MSTSKSSDTTTINIKKGDCLPLKFINEDDKTVLIDDKVRVRDKELVTVDLDDIDYYCGLAFKVKKIRQLYPHFHILYGDIYVTPDILKKVNKKYRKTHLTNYQTNWLIRTTGSRTMGSHGDYGDDEDDADEKRRKKTQWIYKTGKKNYSVRIVSSDKHYMKMLDKMKYEAKIFDDSLLINMSL